jgi:hypothetical protein
VKPALVQQIWSRAQNRCEYCPIPHPHYRLPFQIDHIISRQHGGKTIVENLALACLHCNRHKGPNIAGWDSDSHQLVRLFHPRTDLWVKHFRFDSAYLLGKTPIGRATVQVLAMNAEDLLLLRVELLKEGITCT